MNHRAKISFPTCLWIVLISVLLIRLLFLGAYPLADTTEARYAEMGRLIVDTGDWVTPQISKGIPFWGKPPLSFWLTALSYKMFGVHEFSARLPSFLLALTILGLTMKLALYQTGGKSFLTASVVMASSVMFWISSGAVMTDHCLLAGTTLCMVSFWLCLKSPGKQGYLWGLLFFVGLSIGLMAKGPVAAILIFFPIFQWSIIRKMPFIFFQKLPWITGSIIMLSLTIPWYWMAEIKTPGFLEYFFIGEHWKRFLIPGWQGDLYGSAHSQPRGMIWLFWLICAFPWSFIILYKFTSKNMRQIVLKKYKASKGWYLYLILWSITPMLFFTMAGNILWAYVLPGIPAFAIFAAEIFNLNPEAATQRTIKYVSILMISLFLTASIVVVSGIGPVRKSQKQLIKIYQTKSKEKNSKLFYLYKLPFSAAFYSKDKADKINSVSDIDALLTNNSNDYLAIREKHKANIPLKIIKRFTKITKINGYYLYQEKNHGEQNTCLNFHRRTDKSATSDYEIYENPEGRKIAILWLISRILRI